MVEKASKAQYLWSTTSGILPKPFAGQAVTVLCVMKKHIAFYICFSFYLFFIGVGLRIGKYVLGSTWRFWVDHKVNIVAKAKEGWNLAFTIPVYALEISSLRRHCEKAHKHLDSSL